MMTYATIVRAATPLLKSAAQFAGNLADKSSDLKAAAGAFQVAAKNLGTQAAKVTRNIQNGTPQHINPQDLLESAHDAHAMTAWLSTEIKKRAEGLFHGASSSQLTSAASSLSKHLFSSEIRDANRKLQSAVKHSQVREYSDALAKGAYVNRPDQRGSTALHKAVAQHGSNADSIVRALLEHPDNHGNLADVNARDRRGNTASHAAAASGNEQYFEELLNVALNHPERPIDLGLNNDSKLPGELTTNPKIHATLQLLHEVLDARAPNAAVSTGSTRPTVPRTPDLQDRSTQLPEDSYLTRARQPLMPDPTSTLSTRQSPLQTGSDSASLPRTRDIDTRRSDETLLPNFRNAYLSPTHDSETDSLYSEPSIGHRVLPESRRTTFASPSAFQPITLHLKTPTQPTSSLRNNYFETSQTNVINDGFETPRSSQFGSVDGISTSSDSRRQYPSSQVPTVRQGNSINLAAIRQAKVTILPEDEFAEPTRYASAIPMNARSVGDTREALNTARITPALEEQAHLARTHSGDSDVTLNWGAPFNRSSVSRVDRSSTGLSEPAGFNPERENAQIPTPTHVTPIVSERADSMRPRIEPTKVLGRVRQMADEFDTTAKLHLERQANSTPRSDRSTRPSVARQTPVRSELIVQEAPVTRLSTHMETQTELHLDSNHTTKEPSQRRR